jgi:hypothetical protein
MHPVDLVSLAPKNSSSMEEQSVIVTKLHPSCSRPLISMKFFSEDDLIMGYVNRCPRGTGKENQKKKVLN